MNNSKGMLVVIPARGGSKVVPGKNIFHLSGKLLIVCTIEVSLEQVMILRGLLSRVNNYYQIRA